jgi:opacity protein-like surface antigen
VIKQVPSLSVVTVAAIAAAALSAPAAATLAQEQSLESRFLNGSHQDQWKNPYNSGDSLNPDGDSLNPDPFYRDQIRIFASQAHGQREARLITATMADKAWARSAHQCN